MSPTQPIEELTHVTFPPATAKLLRALRTHNDREWFDALEMPLAGP